MFDWFGKQIGLTAKCASQCVTSLTTCTLEMRGAMNKLLTEVLSILTKISATVHIAIPILEFLSSEYIIDKIKSLSVMLYRNNII